jgi:uncharacterized protein YndB with AHSA1/START domain
MSLSAKILLFVIIIAVIGASSLWLLGGKKGEYSTSLIIDASPPQVFPYLTDADLLKQWLKGLAEVENLVENEEGAQALLTKRLMDFGDGRQVWFQDEVIRHETDELISIQSSSSNKVITAIFQLQSTPDDKTELKYRLKISNQSVGRFLAAFEKDDYQKRIENDARKLKELIESTPSSDVADPASSAAGPELSNSGDFNAAQIP